MFLLLFIFGINLVVSFFSGCARKKSKKKTSVKDHSTRKIPKTKADEDAQMTFSGDKLNQDKLQRQTQTKESLNQPDEIGRENQTDVNINKEKVRANDKVEQLKLEPTQNSDRCAVSPQSNYLVKEIKPTAPTVASPKSGYVQKQEMKEERTQKTIESHEVNDCDDDTFDDAPSVKKKRAFPSCENETMSVENCKPSPLPAKQRVRKKRAKSTKKEGLNTCLSKTTTKTISQEQA